MANKAKMNTETSEETAIRIANNSVKGNGRNNPLMTDAAITTMPGENARYAGLLYKLLQWPKIDKNDIDALEQRFVEYLNFCAQNDLKIGNQVCYLALGITKDDVYNWENGVSRGKPYCEFIKKVKAFCAGNREMLMQDGKVWAPTGMFWQKNYDGLRDVQDVVLTPGNPLGDISDPEQIKQRYLDSVPEDE